MLESKYKFESVNDFLSHLTVVEDNTLWERVDVDQIEFAEDPTANPFVAFGGNEFKCVTITYNGGMTYIPWATTALTSVLNRCEISGKGIERLFSANKREFCALLNSTIHLVDKGQREMLALVREDRLGALHSGRYTPISEKLLYKIAEEYLDGFEYHTLKEAEWTPELVSASYVIEDDDLLKAYKKIFGTNSFQCAEFGIRVNTSDVAESAAIATPQLTAEGVYLPLLGGRGVAHKGEVTDERLKAMFYGAFTAFEASFRSLAALADIKIRNKKNAMIKAFTAIKFPQKYCVELCERYDNTTANALDVYMSMAEALATVRKGGMQKALIYEECFCKLLMYTSQQWNSFDVPGVVAWGAKARTL